MPDTTVPTDRPPRQRPADATDEINTYLVTLSTPQGPAQLEIPTSLGFEAAGRRAIFYAASAGWGDLPDLKVTSCTVLDDAS